MRARLTDLFRRWRAGRARRAQLRLLLGRDDRHLADIGLTRADLEAALGAPVPGSPATGGALSLGRP